VEEIMDTDFEAWWAELREMAMEVEWDIDGSEPAWRKLFDQGLTAQQAWDRVMNPSRERDNR
jgi:hypothetical protein